MEPERRLNMQPSNRQKELERAYNARKGHVPQISISDDTHHVTEAIGSYYGNSPTEDSRQNDRPLSFVASPKGESIQTGARGDKRQGSYFDARRTSPPRRSGSGERAPHSSRSPIEWAPQQHQQARSPGSPGSPTSPGEGGRPRSLRRMGSLGRDDVNGSGGSGNGNSGGNGSGQATPPPLTRQGSSETAVQHFPLNDIDYESSPAAVAQELSNLQAIRRMSMNVDMADPDLPSFGGGFGSVPTVAPGHGDDEDDASRLFWVPARLHPELAPKEFKTFVEERVDQIRRTSGDSDTLSAEGLDRSGSGSSSLRRKKSMLSRQIDTKGSYQDGAERLERKRSKGMQLERQTEVSLHELEDLAEDPAQLMRRLSLDPARRSQDSGIEVPPAEDMPILPPVGQSLKRSTRTTYRRGSLRKGERVPFSKRAMGHARSSEQDTTESPVGETPIVPGADEPIMGLTRVHTEPTPAPSTPPESFSGPGAARRRPGLGTSQSTDDLAGSPSATERMSSDSPSASFEEERPAEHIQQQMQARSPPPPQQQQQQFQFPERRSSHEQIVREPQPHQGHEQQPQQQQQQQQQHWNESQQSQEQQQAQRQPQQRQFHSRIASQGRTTAQLPGYNNTNPLPHIIETLPDGSIKPTGQQQYPERKSSHEVSRPKQRGGAHMRPVPGRERAAQSSTLDDISGHPSPLPGSGNMGTDALTMVPTFEEKKSEKIGRKSSWKWILGSDDEDKTGKKGKESKEEEAQLTKPKANKLSKASDKTRMDLLQTSIDGGTSSRGRESLVLDRESVKVDDERKKESSSRKYPSDTNRSGKDKDKDKDKEKEKDGKEGKDSSILSALFGGGKKKTSDNDLKGDKKRSKHLHERNLSPDPLPARILKPDIDYNWTRFSILEERAIYRMAHMKLANPRRALYSQVLLSNFMYSYLAKVQMMHPQMQIPGANKANGGKSGGKKEEPQQQPQQQQQQQPVEYSQYQRWQEQQARQDSSGTSSSSPYPQTSHSSPYDSYDTDQSSPGGSEHHYPDASGGNGDYYSNNSRSSSHYSNPAAQQRANGIMTGSSEVGVGVDGGGYSVSSTHDYLGYSKERGKVGVSSGGGGGLWDEGEREEELW